MTTHITTCFFLSFLALDTGLRAAVTADFDPAGELASQFTIVSGSQYSESASGGLNSSVGVALANLQVSTFDGTQSESLSTGGIGNGRSFTVGAYFNMSSFGTVTGTNGQILRLGLTNGGPDNFSELPFSTIEMVDTTNGVAKFVARQSLAADTNTLTLGTGQWYYFETTFTRGANDDLTYDMVIANSSASGVIGSVVHSYSYFQVTSTDPNDQVNGNNDLNLAIYGGFKGNATDATGVLDNFYVSNAGISQIPEPRIVGLSLLGMIGLILRRRR